MNIRTSTAGTTVSLNEVTLLVRSMSSTLNALQDQVNRMQTQLQFMSNTMSQSPHAYTPPQYSQYVPQMGYLPSLAMHSSVPQNTVPPLSVPLTSVPQKIEEKATPTSGVDNDDHSSSSSSASTSAAPSTESEKKSSKHRHSSAEGRAQAF